MDLGIVGKCALITGGGRGIGKAIAMSLAIEGVDVAVASRTKSELDQTVKEIQNTTNRRAIPIVFDVRDKNQVNRTVHQAADFLGGLDILVNSAALPSGSLSASGPIETVIEEELLYDFEVKYVGALRCVKASIPHLKKGGWGRIINISGMNARRAGNLTGGARNVPLVHFTKTLSLQLGEFGITSNCIHPGVTRTERTPNILKERGDKLGLSPREVEENDYAPGSDSGNSIARMVDAFEIASVATFLASNKASSITGEVIVADGGTGNSVYY